MSSDIEKKIVEIEFQNRNFEKSIKQSQKSIDELNKSLEFKGSEKNIEKVQKALKETELHSLSANVKKISDKFSELGIIGTTALMRITNAAITTGKQLVKSFTIDPIISGLQEYETQMNSVQTILANTKSKGTNIDQVNAALDELNRYADKTIYNFTEMTRNIGTFTAAGVDLKTSVDSIQGIANLAAVSGSNAQQASTAMYQLSQALAAGRVSLMDWNSVVNAGMGGEVFQKALQQTSKELGTGAEAAIAAKGSFRSSLETGWLTSEVLTETLKKFTTSGANEWVAEYTGLTKEAVAETLKAAEAQYGEAEAIEQASKQLAEKSGKNQQEIKDILEMAKTAEDAATKVKTFTQLMDTLKEAVQSGWSETWRTVIGDFEEAKELFTGIKDAIEPVIMRSAELRNNMLKVWKSLGGRTKLLEGLGNISRSILDIWNSIYQAFYDVFGIVGKELYAMTVQFTRLTMELTMNEKTMEDIKRVVRGFASVLSIVVQIVSGAAKAIFQVFIYLKPLLSNVLHFFAILGDGISIVAYIIKQTQIFNRLGMAVARTLLLIGQIAKNLMKIAAAAGLIVAGAIFSVVKAIVTLYNTIKERFGGIGGFIEQRFPALGKVLDAVSSAFEDFAHNVKIFVDSIKQTFTEGDKIVVNLHTIAEFVKTIFSGLLNFIVSFGKNVGNVLSSLFSIMSLNDILKAAVVITLLSLLLRGLMGLINGLGGLLAGIAESVSESIKKIGKSIANYINAKAMNERSEALLNVAKSVALLAASLIALTFVDQKNLEHAATVLGIFTGALIVLTGGISLFAGGLIKKGKIAEHGMSGFTTSIVGIALGMVVLIKAVSSMQEAMNKTTEEGDTSFVAALWHLIGAFTVLVALATLMTIFTSRFAPKSAAITLTFVAQILSVVSAMKQLADPSLNLGKSIIGLTAIGIFLGVLTVIQIGASKASQEGAGKDAWKNVIASVLGIKMLMSTMLKINDIPNEVLVRTLLKSSGVILAFQALMRAAAKVAGDDASKTIRATTVAFLGLVLAMKVLSKLDKAEIIRGSMGVLAMMGPLAIMMLITKIPSNKIEASYKTILSLTAAVTAMALCAAILSLLDPKALARGTIAISVMAGVMGGVVALTRFVNKASNGIKAMVTMTVIIGVVSLCAGILSTLDTERLLVSFAGIAAVLAVMPLIFLAVKNIDAKSAWSAVAIIGPLAAIAGVMILLDKLDVEASLETMIGMAAVLSVMSLVFLTAKGLDGKTALSLLAVAVPILAIGAVVAVLGKLDVNPSIETAGSLAILMLSLSVCMMILSKINIEGILYGCAGLIAVALTLMFLFGLFSTAATLVGDGGDAIKNGAQLFGDAVGMFIGGLVGGIGAGIAEMLPFIGNALSEFMANVQGFIEGSKNMKDVDFGSLFALAGLVATLSVTAVLAITIPILAGALNLLGIGVKSFVDSVAGLDPTVLTAVSNILLGVGNLAYGMAGFSSSNLTSFGEQLPELAKNIVAFCNALLGEDGGASLDVASAQKGAEIFAAFAKVASTVPRSGGMIGAILGDVNLEGFVGAMGQAGPAIKSFHDSVLGLDSANTQEGLKILEETIRVAAKIPNSGGWLGEVMGENDLDAFAGMMVNAGPDIKQFATDIAGLSYSSAEGALKILDKTTEVAAKIPNSGGWIGAVVGENDLDAFAGMMENAGPHIAAFVESIKGVNYLSAIQGLMVLERTIDAATYIPNSGDSVVSWFVGDNSLANFAEQMASAGEDIATFINAMPSVKSTTGANGQTIEDAAKESEDVYDYAFKAIEVLGAIITVASSIDTQSGWEKFWSGSDNSLTSFGTDLAGFAPNFAIFLNSIAGVDMSAYDMSKKTEAAIALIGGISAFTGLGDTTLPDLSSVNGQNTMHSFINGMKTASDDEASKTAISEAGNKIFTCISDSMSEDDAKWIAKVFILHLGQGLSSEVYLKSATYTKLGTDILKDISSAFSGQPIKDTAKALSDGLVKEVKEYLGIESPSKKFQQIGIYIVDGLSLGLQNGNSEVKKATDQMASTVENQFRKDMGINSPSKLFTKLGGYVVDGLKNGLSSGGSMKDILGDVLGGMDFGSMFGDYGSDMKNIFSGTFDNIDLGNFSLESLDDGSFVDGLMTKIQDQMDDQGLTADVEAVFDADAMQKQLDGMSGTLSTTGTGSVAGATMTSFENTKFEDDQNSESGGKNSFSFVQNNYSPTALDRIAIYRQTRNQFAAMKEVINRV